MGCFPCQSIKTEQRPVLSRNTHTPFIKTDATVQQIQGEIQRIAFSRAQAWTHAADRQRTEERPKEREVETLNPESLLVKWLQGQVLFFLSSRQY